MEQQQATDHPDDQERRGERPRFRRPPTAYLAAAAAVPLLAAWSAYAQVSATVYYATVTWNRLLLQGCVPVFGLVALGVRRLLLHFPRA